MKIKSQKSTVTITYVTTDFALL